MLFRKVTQTLELLMKIKNSPELPLKSKNMQKAEFGIKVHNNEAASKINQNHR